MIEPVEQKLTTYERDLDIAQGKTVTEKKQTSFVLNYDKIVNFSTPNIEYCLCKNTFEFTLWVIIGSPGWIVIL